MHNTPVFILMRCSGVLHNTPVFILMRCSGGMHNTPVFILRRCSGAIALHTCIHIEEMLLWRDAWVGIVTVGRYIVRIKGLQDCERLQDCRIAGL